MLSVHFISTKVKRRKMWYEHAIKYYSALRRERENLARCNDMIYIEDIIY